MSTDSSDLFGALFEVPPVNRTVPVLVPMPAPKPYSYSVPEGMAVEPGSVVQVPLGPRQVIGVVWDSGEDGVDPKKLRPITHVFDCPPLNKERRDFIDWVAAYTGGYDYDTSELSDSEKAFEVIWFPYRDAVIENWKPSLG